MESIQNLLDRSNSKNTLRIIRPPDYSDIVLTSEEVEEAIDKALRDKYRDCLYSDNPIPFEEVTLDTEEKSEAMRKARSLKSGRIYTEKYKERIRSRTFPRYTADQMLEVIKAQAQAMGKTLDLDDENRNQIILLCQYFTADPAFEAEGRSLKKGLNLTGPIGCGKTFLMNLLRMNQASSFRVVSTQNLAALYAQHGDEAISQYGKLLRTPVNYYGQTEIGTCFDDLGTEDVAQSFGNRVNVMSRLLLSIYDHGQFNHFHITTNLSAKQIEEVYGSRVRDRMREMFNTIRFDPTSKSRRR